MRRCWFLAFLAATALAVISVYAAAPAPDEGKGFVGSDTCLTCHEDHGKMLAKNVHGKLENGSVACESCHGPGKAHVDGGGDTKAIINPAKVAASKTDAMCMKCHDQQEGRRFFATSPHAREGLSCASCHTVHSPKKTIKGMLRKGSTTALCLSCHKNKEKSLFMRSRHPLREGKMECTSCHNPHGTATRHMLKAQSANDLCYKCHTEKRGPYLFPHTPVTENCMNCHNPHGSNQDNLLVRRETRLCQSCHIEGKHQSFAGKLNDTWDSYRMCTNCHTNIHGSNHPSGYKFLR